MVNNYGGKKKRRFLSLPYQLNDRKVKNKKVASAFAFGTSSRIENFNVSPAADDKMEEMVPPKEPFGAECDRLSLPF